MSVPVYQEVIRPHTGVALVIRWLVTAIALLVTVHSPRRGVDSVLLPFLRRRLSGL